MASADNPPQAEREEESEFKEMELWEHLAELRARLIRGFVYIVLGVIIGWLVYEPVFDILRRPLAPVLDRENVKIVFNDLKQPFFMKLQVAVVTGLIGAIPCIMGELWGFISPGLTRKERRAFYIVVPLSIFFFLTGIATGYFLLTPIVKFFASYLPDDVELYQAPLEFVLFVSKIILAFGVTFQLPIVLMFLSYVGIVNSRMLIGGWQYAIMGNLLLAALITPTPDAFNMMLLATPLMLLYVVGIFLVKFVERVKARQERAAGHDTS